LLAPYVDMARTVRQVIAALEDAGWRQVRQTGSHRQFVHPSIRGTLTVAGKLRDNMPPGTLASIRRLSGLEELR
jgi:predicted RNA binding protein YcfA (HicA-like mRNA interferase family)